MHTDTIFTQQVFHTSKTWDNVFYSNDSVLKERVEFFKNRRDWYDKRGIPWTLGIVLYGPPGCGKTSTVKAIAKMLNRHIVATNWKNLAGKRQAKALVYDDYIMVDQSNNKGTTSIKVPIDQRLFLIEDMDCQNGENEFLMKRSKNPNAGKRKLPAPPKRDMFGNLEPGSLEGDSNDLDMATILNIMDGALETPGRVIIFTSNYPQDIDPALMRPGRIDLCVELGKIDNDPLVRMFRNFFDLEDAENLPKNIYKVPNGKWTPAEATQIMFRTIGHPNSAARNLLQLDPKKEFPFFYAEDDKQ